MTHLGVIRLLRRNFLNSFTHFCLRVYNGMRYKTTEYFHIKIIITVLKIIWK